MPVYQPTHSAFLDNDLNDVLKRIQEIYILKTEESHTEVISKLADESGEFWASEANTAVFNSKVPLFKNLLRDMYSFVESYWGLVHKDFNPAKLEAVYPRFKNFRDLNNVFKHPHRPWPQVGFVKVVQIDTKHYDLCMTLTYKDKPFQTIGFVEIVQLFLTMIREWKLVSIQKAVGSI